VRIVMCEPRDTALIEDLERMLGSKIEPCLGLEAEMEEYFGKCSPEFFQEERAG